jgi:hypothetical protein
MSDQIKSLDDLCREMELWRNSVGLTEDDDWGMRNSGNRRTPVKRELLRRMSERSHAAGFEPFPANY